MNPKAVEKLDIELSPEGQLAKVTAVSEDRLRVFVEYRDGRAGWFDHSYPSADAIVTGDVLFISRNEDASQATKVPGGMWPEQLWIGVVKIVLDDVTIIDSNYRLRSVPTMTVPQYKVGNTVEAGDVQGVTRVLSEKAIRQIELPDIDDSVINNFLVEPSDVNGLDFEDFGGMKGIVQRARELIEVPLQHQDALLHIGAPPIKGVLFTGQPGTGKTMLARIIASKCGAAFYQISGPEIFSKWYGQSEELLRKLFDAAKACGKAIIFFDEIDSVAAQRGDQSHEVSKRVVAQLLTLMDGFSSDANIVVIAATNRPQDLDVALRRPGRFDWNIEFPYPNEEDRIDILRKTSKRLHTREPLPHESVAKVTEGWSGAELAAIWKEAALLAVTDGRKEIYEEDYLGGVQRVVRYRIT